MRNGSGRRGLGRAALAALCTGVFLPSLAKAQEEVVVTPAEREAVIDQTQGIRSGSFIFIPSVSGELAYDDNIFATDTGAIDDFIATVRPSLEVRTDRSDMSLRAYMFYRHSFFFDTPSENSSSYGAQLAATYQLEPRTPLRAEIRAVREVESRRSLGANRLTSEPVQYTDLEGSIGASTDTGPVYLAATARARRILYGEADVGGIEVSQRNRNLSIFSGLATAGYTIQRLTRVTFDVGVERRIYDVRAGEPAFDPLTNVDRSATGARFEFGIQRDLTALISGTVRIGYLDFNYADPRLIDINAFSYFGDLRWSVTPLTTLRLTASRRVDETVSQNSAGNLRDEVALSATHELLRTLFLDGTLRYADITPTGVQADSNEFELNLAARYYFGRRFRLEASYNRAQRTSLDRSIAFKDNRFMIGLRIAP